MIRRCAVSVLVLTFAFAAAAAASASATPLKAAGGPAFAASRRMARQDKEAVKKRILEKIEARLKAEEEKILKEIGKIVDEELSKLEGRAPKETPKAEVKEPKAEAKKPGFLGIQPGEGDEEGVIVIDGIVENSPAEKAGLKAGDVIVAIGKTQVDSMDQLYAAIGHAGAGTKVTIKISREGEESTVEATLAPRPAESESPAGDEGEGDDPPPSDDGIRERLKRFMDKTETPKKDAPKDESKAPSVGDRVRDLLAKPGIQKGLKAAVDQLKKMDLKFDAYIEVKDDGTVDLTEAGRKALDERLSSLNPETLDRRLNQLKRFVEEFADSAPEAIQDRIKAFLTPHEKAPPSRPLLGVRVEPIGDDVRAQFDLEEGVGVSVAEIAKDSPAEKAGLKKDDIIVSIDGKPLKGELDLMKRLRSASAGQQIEIRILRDGKEQTVKAKLGGE